MYETVLLTGANGFLGFHILLELLRAGFTVRAAVRSPAKVDSILQHPLIRKISPGLKLLFVIVPDMRHQGAYDEAVRGVSYVLHVASPLATEATSSYKESILDPALKGTVNMLASARKSKHIKRVVLTSSFVANRPLGTCSDTATTPDTRVPIPQGPFGGPYLAYAASKTMTLNATDVIFNELKPQFDIFSIIPGHIVGRNELATTTDELIEGSNKIALGHLVGKPIADKTIVPPRTTAHIEDVVKVHVEALHINATGRQVFGVTSSMDWNDSFAIVKKHFPEAAADGVFRDTKQLEGEDFPWDASETERIFKMRFKDYEQQVKSVAEQYLELCDFRGTSL